MTPVLAPTLTSHLHLRHSETPLEPTLDTPLHLGYVVRLVLICKVGFAIIIMKSKGSHGSMSLALRSYGSPLALALLTFSVFGIASESDVVGPGGDLPLLCLFPMATHDKLKYRVVVSQ